MILKDLIQSIYKDLVKAQYDAYSYSLELREQAPDSLFPIPTAKADDVALTIHYAFGEELPQIPKQVLNKPLFFKKLSNTTHKIIQDGVSQLIMYITAHKEPDDPSWGIIKKELKKGVLIAYVTESIMVRLQKNHKKLIDAEHKFSTDYFSEVIISDFKDDILLHQDMKPLTPGDRKWMQDKITSGLQVFLPDMQKLVQENVITEFTNDREIIVDAAQLKTFPQEAIQQLKINLKVEELPDVVI